MQARTLIVAGATGYGAWPANTIEGALHCLRAPIDGVEIDVQMTADGHVIAHHDYRLARAQTRLDGQWLTERSAPLKTLKLEEVQRFDVGRIQPGTPSAARHSLQTPIDGAIIPTLSALLAVLNAAPSPRRLLYVEIKTDPQDPANAPPPELITNAVIDDLERADYIPYAKIIAFDWLVLRLARARRPTLATAHLTIPAALSSAVKPLPSGRSPWTDGCDPLDHGASPLRAIKAHGGVEWSPHFTEITPEALAEAHDLDLRVGPWGLSTRPDIERMQTLGVFSATVSGPYWGEDFKPGSARLRGDAQEKGDRIES